MKLINTAHHWMLPSGGCDSCLHHVWVINICSHPGEQVSLTKYHLPSGKVVSNALMLPLAWVISMHWKAMPEWVCSACLVSSHGWLKYHFWLVTQNQSSLSNGVFVPEAALLPLALHSLSCLVCRTGPWMRTTRSFKCKKTFLNG